MHKDTDRKCEEGKKLLHIHHQFLVHLKNRCNCGFLPYSIFSLQFAKQLKQLT